MRILHLLLQHPACRHVCRKPTLPEMRKRPRRRILGVRRKDHHKTRGAAKQMFHTDDIVQVFGIEYHYNSMSRGVLDSRDLIYFVSLIGVFMAATVLSLGRRRW